MTLALAATFNPRGEIGRLHKLYPLLRSVYSDIVISMPPQAAPEDVAAVDALSDVIAFVNTEWAYGRYMALKKATQTSASHIQYADLDRLLRWAETRPEEWRTTAEAVERCECLVIGRTQAAWATHPQSMRLSEKLINDVFSYLLGQEMDFGAGAKGFNRPAAEFLVQHGRPDHALGTDTEWPVLLNRAGFRIEGVLVDGLDWEIPDQYQEQAADANRQHSMIEAYDQDAKHWEMRIRIATEIVEIGLEALHRELTDVRQV